MPMLTNGLLGTRALGAKIKANWRQMLAYQLWDLLILISIFFQMHLQRNNKRYFVIIILQKLLQQSSLLSICFITII
jgi:hypothetical protein